MSIALRIGFTPARAGVAKVPQTARQWRVGDKAFGFTPGEFFTVDADDYIVQAAVTTQVTEGDTYASGVANAVPFLNGASQWTTSAGFVYDPDGTLTVSFNAGHTGRAFEVIENGARTFQWYGSTLGLNVAGTPQATIHAIAENDYVGIRYDGVNMQTADYLNFNSDGNTGGNILKIDVTGNTILNNSSYLRLLYDGTTTVPALQIGDSEVGLNGFSYDAANGIRVISGGSYSHTFTTRLIRQGAYGGPGTEYALKAQYPIGWTNQTGTNLGLYAGSGSGSAGGGDIIFYSSNTGGTSGTSEASAIEKARLMGVGYWGVGTSNPGTTAHFSGGVTGTQGAPSERVLIVEGSLPEIWLKDTFGSNGLTISKYNNNFYLTKTNSSGGYTNHVLNIDINTPRMYLGGGSSPSAVLQLAASSASYASLRLTTGVAPAAPNDGDMWQNGTNWQVRMNGVTYNINLTAA